MKRMYGDLTDHKKQSTRKLRTKNTKRIRATRIPCNRLTINIRTAVRILKHKNPDDLWASVRSICIFQTGGTAPIVLTAKKAVLKDVRLHFGIGVQRIGEMTREA